MKSCDLLAFLAIKIRSTQTPQNIKLLEQVNRESKLCVITSRKGDGVLISKAD